MGYFTGGEVALVTGAGGGIGRATAEAFAREGARVLVVDLDGDGAAETVDGITRAGGEALAVAADVTDEAQVEAMVRGAVDEFGRLDCAHNNAGASGQLSAFTDLSRQEWDGLIALNLTSVFLCLKHELSVMAEAGRGAIVNTSSGAGHVGFAGLPHYVASKHGVLGLTKTAAQEFAARGVRINAICPGTTDTPMIRAFIGGDEGMERMMKRTVPTGELGRPEQIAEAVVWLCSDRASFVNGENLIVDGGGLCR